MSRFPLLGTFLLVLAASCASSESEGTSAGECIDGADNDGNGLFDCEDYACMGSPDCGDDTATEEAGPDACSFKIEVDSSCQRCLSSLTGSVSNSETYDLWSFSIGAGDSESYGLDGGNLAITWRVTPTGEYYCWNGGGNPDYPETSGSSSAYCAPGGGSTWTFAECVE